MEKHDDKKMLWIYIVSLAMVYTVLWHQGISQFGFFVVLVIGFLLQRLTSADKIADFLKRGNKILVFIFTVLLIAGLDVRIETAIIWLFIGGVAIQTVPSVLSLITKKKFVHYSRDLLSFGTYGGGNRGFLALSLISPSLLPFFIIADIGNALSLFLVYPLVQHWGKNWKVLRNILIVIGLVCIGVVMNIYDLFPHGVTIGSDIIKEIVKVTIALQIGIEVHLRTVKTELFVVFVRLVRVRILIFTPILIAFYITKDPYLLTLLIFAILPVSSIAPTLCRSSRRQDIQRDVVITSALFALFLGVAIIFFG